MGGQPRHGAVNGKGYTLAGTPSSRRCACWVVMSGVVDRAAEQWRRLVIVEREHGAQRLCDGEGRAAGGVLELGDVRAPYPGGRGNRGLRQARTVAGSPQQRPEPCRRYAPLADHGQRNPQQATIRRRGLDYPLQIDG